MPLTSNTGIATTPIRGTKLKPEAIEASLSQAGYMGELPMPFEVGASAANQNRSKAFFRHTAAYEQTGATVSFTQQVPFSGRPLWPCPGMGAIENLKE